MTKKMITFTYKHAIDYQPELIMGLWGSINPRGFIEMHFYNEFYPLPESSTHELKQGELSGTPVSRMPEKVPGPVRVFKQGILVDLPTAKGIYDWLGIKIKELEKLAGSSAEDILVD
jgi:hypothetical protein